MYNGTAKKGAGRGVRLGVRPEQHEFFPPSYAGKGGGVVVADFFAFFSFFGVPTFFLC